MNLLGYRLPIIFALAAMVLALAACSSKDPRPPRGALDTPEHHYRNGMLNIDQGDLGRASIAFNNALSINRDYGPALAGKGLVLAMRGDDEGLDLIDDGRDEAESIREQMWAIMAEIRAYTVLAEHGLLDDDPRENAEDLISETEDAFDDGLDIVEDDMDDPETRELEWEEAALYYYQGLAYLRGHEYDKAERMFSRVARLKQGYEIKAEKAWRETQDIRRAAPRSSVGERVALVDAITRADMAALLTEELGVDRFMEKTRPREKSAFKTPPPSPSVGNMRHPDYNPVDEPVDILNHPLREDMRNVIQHGFRGLRPYPDRLFKPEKRLSRAEVALILEDVIVRATSSPRLATMFIGQKSPFRDVRGDHPYFNSVMLVTTRGLMESEARMGLFRPLETVSGVEALTAVHKLKDELRVF